MKTLSDRYKNQSLSHATMRTEDLVPVFIDFLDMTKERTGVSESKIKYLKDEWKRVAGTEEEDYLLHEEIWPMMNDIAPEMTYFGAHPGDGSDYGFWEVEEEVFGL
jgi:hypothetical protein